MERCDPMVLLLAVQSVERKIEMQTSVIVGNYEFYYASGKLAALTDLPAEGSTPPMELKEQVMTAIEGFSPADPGQSYLVRLLDRYRPSEAWDEQMEQLFLWGKTGKQPEMGK